MDLRIVKACAVAARPLAVGDELRAPGDLDVRDARQLIVMGRAVEIDRPMKRGRGRPRRGETNESV